MNDDLSWSVLVSSCDAYSDLWSAAADLMNENFPDRGEGTYLLTDKPTSRELNGFSIISVGENTQIPQRLKAAAESIKSEYILITLDDYFLTEKINSALIRDDVAFMKEHSLDFLQLYHMSERFLRRTGAKMIGSSNIYNIDLNTGSYKVNLEPGIWKRTFLADVLDALGDLDISPWQFEVSLQGAAKKIGAACATSNRREFPYLDVIRKGKILNKANKYFKSNPIYSSNREIMKRKDEAEIFIRTFILIHLI